MREADTLVFDLNSIILKRCQAYRQCAALGTLPFSVSVAHEK